jgi:hypothetical protein
LDFKTGVLAVPFEWAGPGNTLKAAIVEQVVTDTVPVEIVTEPIDMAVRVTGTARELMLKSVS